MRGRHDLAGSSWCRVRGAGDNGTGGGGGGHASSGSDNNNSTSNKVVISAAKITAGGAIVAAIIVGVFGLIAVTEGPGGDGPTSSRSVSPPGASSPPTADIASPITPPATPTVVPGTPLSDVSAEFVGTWSGSQTQFVVPFNYPTTITISAGRNNEKIGVADYPSLPCRFALKLIDSTPTSINIEASVISGDCTAPEMRFAVDGSDALKYDLYYGGKRVGYGNVSRGHK